jgi:hypothetical protein
MDDHVVRRAFDPAMRLTPYVLFDLERIAWIAEQRSAELNEQEREILLTAADRLRAAAEGAGPAPGVAGLA